MFFLFSEKEYALMPPIFHLDDWDRCMLLQEDAFYCNIRYDLEPLDQTNHSKIWSIIDVKSLFFEIKFNF